MSSVSTFGAFTTARLGMYAAMKGLDVTGHNISNINTRGYSRQKLDQRAMYLTGSDRYSSPNDARVGSGVLCTGISQLRDPYLDIRYRNDMAGVGELDGRLGVLDELTSILDEVGKGKGDGVIEKQITDFIEKLSSLSNNTNMEEYQTLVRTSASTLISFFKSNAKALEKIKTNTENGFKKDMTRANEILKQIADYNDSIRKSEIHGDSALEQRDQRNVLIDELSQYMKIDVTYAKEDIGAGVTVEKLIIKMGDGNTDDITLVEGAYAGQLSFAQEPAQNPKFDPAQATTNGFGLYLLNANGDTTNDPALAMLGDSATYNLSLSELTNRHGDVMFGSTAKTPAYEEGMLQSTREMLISAGEYTPASIYEHDGAGGVRKVPNPNYTTSVSKRGIPYYQKSMDALANKFAEVLNKANPKYLTNAAGNYTDAEGKELRYGATATPPNPGTPIKPDDFPLTDPDMLAFFNDNVGVVGGTLISNSDAGDDFTGITAANISISKGWTNNTTKLATYTKAEDVGSTSNSNINHIIIQLRGKHDYAPSDLDSDLGSSNVYTTGNFQEMYTNFCGILAMDVSTTGTLLQNRATSTEELDISRGAVSGVDLNDEAANMMMYQKSYAAAARLMTTIDEALDKLINGTGVVGR